MGDAFGLDQSIHLSGADDSGSNINEKVLGIN
jgi:hypothetical protein